MQSLVNARINRALMRIFLYAAIKPEDSDGFGQSRCDHEIEIIGWLMQKFPEYVNTHYQWFKNCIVDQTEKIEG